MSVVKRVAKARFLYHANMASAVNVLNQLHLMSDEKANEKNKKHVFECLDALEHIGYDLSSLEKES